MSCFITFRHPNIPEEFKKYPKEDGFPVIPEEDYKAWRLQNKDYFKAPTEQEVASALVGSVKAGNKGDLISIVKRLFNIGHEKGTAVGEIADRMFKQMAKRAGISIEDAYTIVNWKKATTADKAKLSEKANVLLQEIEGAELGKRVSGTFYRAGEFSGGKYTAQQIVNFEAKELGNKDIKEQAEKSGVDLKNSKAIWVTKTKKQAERYVQRDGDYEELEGIPLTDEELEQIEEVEIEDGVVIFDGGEEGMLIALPKDVKFQKTGSTIQGAVEFLNDLNAIIYAVTNPNVSTPLHELAHIYEKYLTPEEIAQIEEWSGKKVGTKAFSESFATGFEKYLMDGKAPAPEMQSIFDKFKEWLTAIYKGLKGVPDIVLNDPMRNIYSEMLGVLNGKVPKPHSGTASFIPVHAQIRAIKSRVIKGATFGGLYTSRTVDEIIKEAVERHVSTDGNFGNETRIAQNILDNHHIPSDAEQIAMGYAVLRKEEALVHALKEQDKAELQKLPDLKQYNDKVDEIRNDLVLFLDALDLAGSRLGVALRIRQQLLTVKRYDAATLKKRFKASLPARARNVKLTPEEESLFKKMEEQELLIRDQIKELQGQVERHSVETKEKMAAAQVKVIRENNTKTNNKILKSTTLAQARAQLEDVLSGKIC